MGPRLTSNHGDPRLQIPYLMPCGACCGATGLSYGYGFGNQTFVDSLYPSQWDVPGMTLDEFSQKLAQAPLLSQVTTMIWRES
jgi:hypothetical protein